MSNLQTAINCSDDLYSNIYSALYERAASENNALYMQALSKAKTKKQKEDCAGYYCGRWQTMLNKWCSGKIANIHAISAISQNHVDECFLLE